MSVAIYGRRGWIPGMEAGTNNDFARERKRGKREGRKEEGTLGRASIFILTRRLNTQHVRAGGRLFH